MDDFGKYAAMRDRQATPREVYDAGRADSLDEITLLRMVRAVFGLTLREAKRVTGAAATLEAGPVVTPGKTVSWEGWTSVEGFYLVEAEVESVADGWASLTGHKKYRLVGGTLEPVPVEGPVYSRLRVSHLELPLGARLKNLIEEVAGFAEANGRHPADAERQTA